MRKTRVLAKRELRDKVEAVRRVLGGEPKAAVRTSLGVAESTLRGWLKAQDIVLAAESESQKLNCRVFCPDGVAATPTVRLDVSSLKANRSYKNYADSEGTTSGSSSPQSCEEQLFHSTTSDSDEELLSNSSSGDSLDAKTERIRFVKRRIESSDDDDDLPPAERRFDNQMSCCVNQQITDVKSALAKCEEELLRLREKRSLLRSLLEVDERLRKLGTHLTISM